MPNVPKSSLVRKLKAKQDAMKKKGISEPEKKAPTAARAAKAKAAAQPAKEVKVTKAYKMIGTKPYYSKRSYDRAVLNAKERKNIRMN